MVINNNPNVHFVSYTGSFPNLCSGVLTLDINGREVKFGHDISDFDWHTGRYNDTNYDSFWVSGGYLDSEYYSHHGEWEIYVNKLPAPYQQYAYEIDTVFNDNVPHGCCGGCA